MNLHEVLKISSNNLRPLTHFVVKSHPVPIVDYSFHSQAVQEAFNRIQDHGCNREDLIFSRDWQTVDAIPRKWRRKFELIQVQGRKIHFV